MDRTHIVAADRLDGGPGCFCSRCRKARSVDQPAVRCIRCHLRPMICPPKTPRPSEGCVGFRDGKGVNSVSCQRAV